MMYEGYPAYKGGLKIGDEVIKMDEVELRRSPLKKRTTLCADKRGQRYH